MPVLLDLPGPSRRIRVEPLRLPGPAQQPAPPREPDREPAPEREPVSVGASGGNGESRETVSFEDSWEDTARSEFGDLGPDDETRERTSGGGGGGGRRGGRRGGGRR